MVGFAYAVVGMKDGRPMLWSHMTGVLPEYRGGLGYRLKLEQRAARAGAGLRPDRVDVRPDAGDERALQLRQARRRGRGIRRELLRRIDERAASRHADRSRGPQLAHRRAARGAAASSDSGPALRAACRTKSPRRRWSTRRSMDGEWRRTRAIDLTIVETGACGSRSRPASPRCSSARRSARSRGAWTCARCSRTYLAKGYRAVDFVLQREAGFGRYLACARRRKLARPNALTHLRHPDYPAARS